jgi:hypothetical protein
VLEAARIDCLVRAMYPHSTALITIRQNRLTQNEQHNAAYTWQICGLVKR